MCRQLRARPYRLSRFAGTLLFMHLRAAQRWRLTASVISSLCGCTTRRHNLLPRSCLKSTLGPSTILNTRVQAHKQPVMPTPLKHASSGTPLSKVMAHALSRPNPRHAQHCRTVLSATPALKHQSKNDRRTLSKFINPMSNLFRTLSKHTHGGETKWHHTFENRVCHNGEIGPSLLPSAG